MGGPIIIATDGSPGSNGAILVGFELARARGVEAEVVTVMPPPPPVMYAELAAVPEAYTMLQTTGVEDLRTSVQAQIDELQPGARPTIMAEVGAPAFTISEHARLREASLIVVGTGPRTAVERWLRSDTAVRVVQLAGSPVLLVPQTARQQPSSALVAIDFSDFSIRAARETVHLLREPGRIILVHVAWTAPEAESLPSLGEYARTYEQGAASRLEELARDLANSAPVQLEYHVVKGDPVRELVSLAGRFNVDLIAAGSQGRGFLGRIFLGSTSTGLIHGARCSVLIVPSAAEAQVAGTPAT
jgi:nucleotide-binding universal stress UspA family protein